MTGEEAAAITRAEENNKELKIANHPHSGFGRIKPGASISQDRGYFRWPECKPPQAEYSNEKYDCRAKDPNMIFEVTWKGHYWDCRADGYGILGKYGNGSIFVSNFDDIELIKNESEYPDIEIGKDLILEILNQIEWDKTRKCYHVHEDKQSPYWMEKMLQAKAKLLEALDILERIR